VSTTVPPRPDVPPGPRPRQEAGLQSVTWRWWEALLVGVLGFFFVGGVLGLVVLALLPEGPTQLVVAGLAGEVGVAATVLLWLRLFHRSSMGALEAHPSRLADVAQGAGAGLVVYLAGVLGVGTLVSLLLNLVSGRAVDSPKQLPNGIHGLAIPLTFLFAVVAAPIAEELFFRGFLFRALRAGRSFPVAAGVSALFFGAAHYIPSAWQNTLMLMLVMVFVGFALAFVYEWRRNLAANIAAHAAFNLVGVVLILTLR
jgi:membrane protease YdiL (CAAX protease family)